MAEFEFLACVVVYRAHDTDNSFWMERKLVLPFVPMEGLEMTFGHDPELDCPAIEYFVRNLSWNEAGYFHALYQEVLEDSDSLEQLDEMVERYKQAGWIVVNENRKRNVVKFPDGRAGK